MSLTLILPPRVTDRAFARLSEICTLSGQTKALRVAVEGGGCYGFKYEIESSLSGLDVTSRTVVWLFFKQFWFECVPVFHSLQGRLAA